MLLVHEGMTIPQCDYLDQTRTHDGLFEHEARGCCIAPPLPVQQSPWRIGGPAMPRRLLDIAFAERCAEEVDGQVFEPGRDIGIIDDRPLLEPRCGVERRQTAPAAFYLERADVADRQVECEADLLGTEGMEPVSHSFSSSVCADIDEIDHVNRECPLRDQTVYPKLLEEIEER